MGKGLGKSSIDYADLAWGVVEGCTPASPGCAHCWARNMYDRFYPGLPFGHVLPRYGRLGQPGNTKPGVSKTGYPQKLVFVAPLGDLMHASVPAEFIRAAYSMMASTPWLTFLVVTKRPERLVDVLYGAEGGYYLGGGDSIKNVWHIASVENQEWADKRIPSLLELRRHGAWPVLGVSYEPAIGPLLLRRWLTGYVEKLAGAWTVFTMTDSHPTIDFVVAGCESGQGRRPAERVWFEDVVGQCDAASVPVFLKQMDVDGKVVHMPTLAGHQWAQMPGMQP